jgi:hypothetical protein
MEYKNPVYNRVDLTKEKVSTLKYGFYLSIIKTGGNHGWDHLGKCWRERKNTVWGE